MATLEGRAVVKVRDGQLVDSIELDGFPIACCEDDDGRLYVTVAQTDGRGFSPVGPVVVTTDEFADRDDLALACALDGEILQQGRTSDLIFPVAELIATLSEALTLHPGDLIFTGTPAGVGAARTPKRYLQPGDLVSTIEGIGDLTVHLSY